MKVRQILKRMLGALLLAAGLYVLVAAPGLLTDSASTAPNPRHLATVQP